MEVMKAIRSLLLCAMLGLSQTALAAGATILYVPMDNRPVCLDYTVQSMRSAGWDVQLPPREYIAGAATSGDSEKLFSWLEQNAGQAVAVVASGDALLYGGLVASRTHEIPLPVLEQRAQRLVQLKQAHGGNKIYIFSTIMRSPKAGSAPTEPAYYSEWGSKIFRLGALEDKLELKQISRRETRELADLRQEIPQEVLQDLYGRRANNIRATELLLHGVESGDFDYLLIGRDDTAEYSQAHREARNMDILVRELPKERIRFFAGADQLGMLLLARANNRLQYELPLVNVTYAVGRGGATVPSYEDDTVAESAKQHILAAGGFPVPVRKNADVMLAVNTPVDGVTREASDETNGYGVPKETADFAHKVEDLLAMGYPVAVADVKFGNGADNALVKTLHEKGLAYSLAAYGGWNTAGNSLGFALAQGLLAKQYTADAHKDLLNVRYLDDWAYQANVRMQTYQQLIWPGYWPNSGLDAEQQAAAEAFITKGIVKITKPYMGDTACGYSFTLPWSRMFEVKVERKNEQEVYAAPCPSGGR